MKKRIAVLLTSLVAAFGVGCATDAKGASCGLLDVLVDGEGTQYCPDEEAPADCEKLNNALVDAAVLCGGGAFTEEELRAELDDRGSLQQCDAAVATSLDFDACVDFLTDEDEPPCEGPSLAPIPEVCVGAVLTSA